MRKRNKRIFEKDAKLKRCGRKNCDNPKTCFTHRENQAKKKGSLYILLSCPTPKEKTETTTNAGKKKKKQEDTTAKDAVASISHSTQKSKNYDLADGTMEKYNDGVKKELVMVWDETISEHRISTELEKSSPHIGKICAMKWGSYINKNADSMDRPSCLTTKSLNERRGALMSFLNF